MISQSDVIVNKLKPKIVLSFTKVVVNTSKIQITRPYRELTLKTNSHYEYEYVKEEFGEFLSTNPTLILSTIASSSFDHLQALTLEYIPLDGYLFGALHSLKNLETLKLEYCHAEDTKMEPIELKKIKHLKVDGLNGKILNFLKIKNLHCLKIHVKQFDQPTVRFNKQLHRVDNLELGQCNSILQASSRGEEINISVDYVWHNEIVTSGDCVVKFLEICNKTSMLTIRGFLFDTVDIEKLRVMSEVTRLDISISFEDGGFKKLLEKLPNVTAMHLRYGCNSAKLLEISKALKKLIHLDVTTQFNLLRVDQ